jgi:hypothetical protein
MFLSVHVVVDVISSSNFPTGCTKSTGFFPEEVACLAGTRDNCWQQVANSVPKPLGFAFGIELLNTIASNPPHHGWKCRQVLRMGDGMQGVTWDSLKAFAADVRGHLPDIRDRFVETLNDADDGWWIELDGRSFNGCSGFTQGNEYQFAKS